MSIENSMSSPGVCPQCGLALQGMESHCPRCGRELSITPIAPPPPAQAAMSQPTQMSGFCSNCGFQLPRFQPLCPNCGTNVTPVQSAQWPPPPAGYAQPASPISKFVTGNAGGDMVLGFILSFVSIFIYGIGMIAMPVLYFSLRPTYRYFARGVGYGLVTFGVLVLGVFVWCFGSLMVFNR
ncbi:MAG: zinc ribbon domain-containing protein [Capsulimonas sp.]|uniref:zinc ribbon domain-containing protein n=1 Tax=Capsulimonas sp. TaxID=2494211 RepID=UPI003264A221